MGIRWVTAAGFLLFSTSISAWDAPWKYSPSPSSPWGGETRREGREGFFANLSAGLSEKYYQSEQAPQRTQRQEQIAEQVLEEAPIEDIDSNKDLASIPWAAHRTIYPGERFSAKLEWPVEGGRVTSGYGIRGGKRHEGLDIGSPEGTSIRAVSSGRVVFSGTLGSYGRTVVVYHGDGVSSIYAHNSSNTKERGDIVRKGDMIARVGRTGHATGNHCHFEIRKDGRPTNPLRFQYSKSPLSAKR